MNLEKLFEMQMVLDEHIMTEHPELRGQNNLDWKILALQVELGECANEWRGFKKWSQDQRPRTHKARHPYMDLEDAEFYNPMFEEYVDSLHLILSIGLEHGFNEWVDCLEISPITYSSITCQFTELMRAEWGIYKDGDAYFYHQGLELFLGLGEMLGFTWEQIEQSYFAKNKVNHQRQESGY